MSHCTDSHAHEPWLERFPAEEVRLAMLWARRIGAASIDGFFSILEDARKVLQIEPQQPALL